MIVYKFQNKVNGKIYIGQTQCSLEKRTKEHLTEYGGATHLHDALEKYGLDNFDRVIIDEANTREELNEKETYWVTFYDCVAPKGYNLTTGGKQCVFTLERNKRISANLKGEKHPMFRKKQSLESNEKRRISCLGKPGPNKDKKQSLITRQKRSESLKGEKNPFYGRKHTLATLRKQSAIKKNKYPSKETLEKMRLSHLGEKNVMFGKKLLRKDKDA